MRVKTCCCGCSLRTGAIVLGILDIIGAISFVISGIANLSNGGNTGVQIASGIFLIIRAICFGIMIYTNHEVKWRYRYFLSRAITIPLNIIIFLLVGILGCTVQSYVDNYVAQNGGDAQQIKTTICASAITMMVIGLIFCFIDIYFCVVLYSYAREEDDTSKHIMAGQNYGQDNGQHKGQAYAHVSVNVPPPTYNTVS